MASIRYIKEPGYVYDLFFLFILYFNKDYCLENYIDRSRTTEETAFLKKLYNEITPVPEELRPFFSYREGMASFISEQYFSDYCQDFTTDYGLPFILSELKDVAGVSEKMIRYYFPDISEDELESCKNSYVEVSKLIKSSDYDNALKSNLYAFFLEPEQTLQILANELNEKSRILTPKYEKGLDEILSLTNSITVDQLSTNFFGEPKLREMINSSEEIYVSFCLCYKNIAFAYYQNKLIFVLGSGYQAYLNDTFTERNLPKLDVFCAALAEPNRVEILNLLYTKGEATIKEIEKKLDLSGTNAYYHLSTMIRAGILKTRTAGRTIYYSVNKSFFIPASKVMLKYSK